MASIQFFETVDGATGRTAAKVRYTFTPTRARVIAGSPDEEVLPKGFEVTLDADGKATVTLAETTSQWCWRVDRRGGGVPAETVYVAVQTGDTEWPNLVRVDPATLSPITIPAAWITDNGDGTVSFSF